MALLSVDDDRLPDDAVLLGACRSLPPGAPVVIMVHGFRFSPHRPQHDPHLHILSLSPDRTCWKAVSWPRHLGLARDRGLAIGFGWPARGSIWRAHVRAALAGARLARLIASLRRLEPDRPVHILAHSLGARVALTALPRLPPGGVTRIILIAAAAFRAETRRALASPAGRSVEVINIIGRENRLFDLLLRAAMPLRGATLGGGVPGQVNWLDLALDRADTLSRLKALGHRIGPVRAPVCHWSGYLRPGIFGLYRALLLHPRALPLAVLRAPVLQPARSGVWGRFAALLAGVAVPIRRRTPF